MEKSYIAIDLKAFYGSVECVERGLDPLTTNLVVAGGEPYTENNLSFSYAFAKKIWSIRQSKTF